MSAAANVVRDLTTQADKQLDIINKSVDSLKEVGYHKFSTQLGRQAYAFGWDKAIHDLSVPALTSAEIAHDDEITTAAGIKRRFDRRNAYLCVSVRPCSLVQLLCRGMSLCFRHFYYGLACTPL